MTDPTLDIPPSTSPPTGENALFANLGSAQGLDLNLLEPVGTPVHAWRTDSGTDVTFVPSRELPIIDLVLRFNAGFHVEGDASGLAALTLHMLGNGTRHLDTDAFAERIEQLGMVIDKRVRLTHATVSVRSISQPDVLGPAIELLTEMLAYPALQAADLDVIKTRLLAYQKLRKAQPRVRARLEAHAHLFAGHPYANALGSTEAGIASITPVELRAFHRRAYSASNLTLSLVGDLSREQAEAIVEQITQALPQGWAAAELPQAPTASATSIHVEQAGNSQSVLLAVPIRILPADPDYPALMLANVVLGSGLESRLMQEVRQRRGLTYGIDSELAPNQAGGVLIMQWDIAAQHAEGSRQLVTSVLGKLVEQGPTQAELDWARQQLGVKLLRGVSRNQSLAAILVQLEQQQPPGQFDAYLRQLEDITPQAVHEALQRHLDLQGMVFVSVGPAAPQLPLPALSDTDQ